MDRKWMSASRLSEEYENGAKEFVRFAVEHAKNPSEITCPCLGCCHSKQIGADELLNHLICKGIDQSYTCWSRHGEKRNEESSHQKKKKKQKQKKKGPSGDHAEEIAKLVGDDGDKPLYDGCTNFTKLSFVTALHKLKVENRWSDESFDELLTAVQDMMPGGNILPARI